MFYDIFTEYKQQNPDVSPNSPKALELLELFRQQLLKLLETEREKKVIKAFGDKANNSFNLVFRDKGFEKDYLKESFVETFGHEFSKDFFTF